MELYGMEPFTNMYNVRSIRTQQNRWSHGVNISVLWHAWLNHFRKTFGMNCLLFGHSWPEVLVNVCTGFENMQLMMGWFTHLRLKHYQQQHQTVVYWAHCKKTGVLGWIHTWLMKSKIGVLLVAPFWPNKSWSCLLLRLLMGPCLLCIRPELVSQRHQTSHPGVIGLVPESNPSILACLQGVRHIHLCATYVQVCIKVSHCGVEHWA